MNTVNAPTLGTLEERLNRAGRLAPLEHKIRQWDNDIVWIDAIEHRNGGKQADKFEHRVKEYDRWLYEHEKEVWESIALNNLRDLFFTLLRRERQRRARYVL